MLFTATYRQALQDGVLVLQKRHWWFWWRFNRSLEDPITKDLNDLAKARDMQRMLERRIPKREKLIQNRKDELQKAASMGGKAVGVPFKDAWRPRKEPVVLFEPRKQPKPKPQTDTKPAKQGPALLELRQPQGP